MDMLRKFYGYLCLEQCDGHCCRIFTGLWNYGLTRKEMIEEYKKKCDKTMPAETNKQNINWLENHVRILTYSEIEEMNFLKDDFKNSLKTIKHNYLTCDLFDLDTGKCTAYNKRTSMCVRFPSGMTSSNIMFYKKVVF